MIAYRALDMMFATKIRAACESSQVASREVRTTDRLNKLLDAPGEEKATALFVDLEVGDEAIDLITAALAHPQPPTVIAFGSHIDTATLDAARAAGANEVLPRSALAARLVELIEAHGRLKT